MNQALFLDRDGVINIDFGYVHKISECHFRPEIFKVMQAAMLKKFFIIIVTNQSGIGRGYYNHQDFKILDTYIYNEFRKRGITVLQTYYCPFHPTYGIGHYRKTSWCRKPSPGMLVEACNKYNINPRFSLMIGDKKSDQSAAFCTGISRYIDANAKDWHNDAIQNLYF